MSSSIVDIETIKSTVDSAGGFLLGTRYVVSFSGTGSVASSIFGSNSNLAMYASSVDTPEIQIGTKDADIFGQKAKVPNSFYPQSVKITFYNTGSEYNIWYNYLNGIYSPTTSGARYFAYRNDLLFDMTIVEYNATMTAIATYTCINCIATKLSGINLSFGAPSSVEDFDVTIEVTGMKYTKKN